MGSYRGRYAELYDLIYAQKPYAQEASFVHECLQTLGDGKVRRVLELACGTGSHAFALSSFGYQITAVDHSPDMLARARSKGTENGSKVDFCLQDVRSLELPDPPYDAALCLFDSIGYVITDEAIAKVLNRLHRHLRSGGLFVFEFWHAPAMIQHYSPVRVGRWAMPVGELLRIAETELCEADQTATVKYSLYELGKNGEYRELHETQRNRYFTGQEMSELLRKARFQPLKFFAGYSDVESLTDECWHVVCVARRQ